jgi:hypothetical protein
MMGKVYVAVFLTLGWLMLFCIIVTAIESIVKNWPWSERKRLLKQYIDEDPVPDTRDSIRSFKLIQGSKK